MATLTVFAGLFFLFILQVRNSFGLKRSNILLILADDLGFNDVDWHDPLMYTPNLRNIGFSRHSVQLKSSYVNQLCSQFDSFGSNDRPLFLSYRYTGVSSEYSSFPTGVFWVLEPTGVPLTFPFFPEKLKQLDYRTHMLGKWHLGYCKREFLPTRRGFDTFHGFHGGMEDYYDHSLSDNRIKASGLDFWTEFSRSEPIPDRSQNGVYSSLIFADATLKILKNHSKMSDSPFFIYLSFQSVHSPLQVPEKYLHFCRSIRNKNRRIYCGMVAAMDEAIGRVVNGLFETGLHNNTIIIFSSDNGGNVKSGGNNYPLRGNKDTLWEGGTRTNSFVYSPRFVRKFAVKTRLFHVVDWYATILGMAGLNRWRYGDGINQWEMIKNGKGSNIRRQFVYNIDSKGSAIRDSRYKLIIGNPGFPAGWILPFGKGFRQTGLFLRRKVWLFNIQNDPNERRDLSRRRPIELRRMKSQLRRLSQSLIRSIHKVADQRGNPIHFNGTFATGWC